MRHIKKISWLAIWLFLMAIALSCTSQPKKSSILPLDVRLKVAKHILADNIKIISIVEVCALYGEEIKKKSIEIQNQWHQENWALVQLGFTEYQTYLHKRIMEIGEVPAYLDVFYLMLQAEEYTKGKPIAYVVENYTQKDRICDDLLFDYRAGQKDIKKNAHHLSVMTSLQAMHPHRQVLSPQKLPELSNGVKPSRSKGISRFAIEKQVKESVCTEGEIISLIDRWPSESYGIYCPNQDPKALICQWGNCQWLDDPTATLKQFLHEGDGKQ